MNINSISIFLSSLGKFWQNRTYSLFFRWNIFLIAAQFFYLFWSYPNLPNQIPLYFSQPWGESWLASLPMIFLLPSFSLIIVLVNSSIALLIHHQKPLLAKILLAFSLLFSILSSVSLFQIINLVI